MNLKKLTQSVAVALCAAMALPAAAAPRLIGAGDVKAAKTTFSLFYVNLSKVRMPAGSTVLGTLQARLDTAGEGITACLLSADVNANNISCGNGLLRLGADLFSTTQGANHVKPTITWLPEDKNTGLDKTSSEAAFNSRASTVVTGPIDSPRVLHIRFSKRIAQFGMDIDPYAFNSDPSVPLTEGKVIDGLQFIVNGQATPVRNFDADLRGDTPFVGVEDPHGFTEVTVIGTGGASIKPDRYTLVPLSNF